MPTRPLRRLCAENDGIAVVEFAATLPFLILIFLGGAEIVNYTLAHMTVNRIGMTVADNASRVTTVIDESDIVEAFAAAQAIGGKMDMLNNSKIVLSSLMPNGKTGSNAGQTINWQRCYGKLTVTPAYGVQGAGATNATLAAGIGPTGSKITAATGTAVMFVEVSYDYQPVALSSLIGTKRIRFETAFNVRGRVNQTITNSGSLTVNSC
jgi:Flp pilus assembly protein TadG